MIVIYANYLAQQGHETTIYCNIKETVFKLSPLVTVKRLPYKGKLGTILWAILNKIKADVIIADIIPLAVILSLRNKGRVFYFAQDYDVHYYPDQARQWLLRGIYFIGLKWIKIPCVAVSESLKEELSPYSRSVFVIHNGIDLNVFRKNPDPQLILSKEKRQAVLIFGRKDPRKGLDVATKVLQTVEENLGPEKLEIWVVGEHIEPSVFSSRVKNFGYVDEEKLAKILSSADLFLYPSRHEGCPLFILEALACQCPVVTTRAIPFLKEIKGDWITEIDDIPSLTRAVSLVLQNASYKKTIYEATKPILEQFSLKDQSQKFECLLYRLYDAQ